MPKIFDDEQAEEILRRHEAGCTINRLAKDKYVSRQTIVNAIRRAREIRSKRTDMASPLVCDAVQRDLPDTVREAVEGRLQSLRSRKAALEEQICRLTGECTELIDKCAELEKWLEDAL